MKCSMGKGKVRYRRVKLCAVSVKVKSGMARSCIGKGKVRYGAAQ